MQLQHLLTGITLLQLATAAPSAREAQHRLDTRQWPVRPCSTGVHVIAAGGRGTPNLKEYGMLYSLAQSIVNAIPDSTNVSLPYDKLYTRENPDAIPGGVRHQ